MMVTAMLLSALGFPRKSSTTIMSGTAAIRSIRNSCAIPGKGTAMPESRNAPTITRCRRSYRNTGTIRTPTRNPMTVWGNAPFGAGHGVELVQRQEGDRQDESEEEIAAGECGADDNRDADERDEHACREIAHGHGVPDQAGTDGFVMRIK